MKRLSMILAFMACLPFFSKAQQGYNKLDLAAGYLLQDQWVGEFSYDLGGRYHSGVEILTDFSYNRKSEIRNWKLGLAYKPLLARSRNTTLNLRLTTSAGTNERKFIAAMSAGLELNFACKSGLILLIRQKNELVLYDQDHWRLGLLAGFKLPIN